MDEREGGWRVRGRQRGITGSGQDMVEREGVESEGRQRGITGSGQDMGEWTKHG